VGRGFLAHPEKKPWIKPELRHFGSPEELLAFYALKGSAAEREKIEKLAVQARKTRGDDEREARPRRSGRG